MSAFSLDDDAHTGRGGDIGYHADINALPLEARDLFNVKLYEGFVMRSRKLYLIQLAVETRSGPDLFERASAGIAQASRVFGREHTSQQSASQATEAKTRRLFRCEEQ